MGRRKAAIVVADANGVIMLWSGHADELIGYSAREMVDQTLDAIVPPAYRDRHWRGFHAAMATARRQVFRCCTQTGRYDGLLDGLRCGATPLAKLLGPLPSSSSRAQTIRRCTNCRPSPRDCGRLSVGLVSRCRAPTDAPSQGKWPARHRVDLTRGGSRSSRGR
jgi:PAS domain-containing protein